MADAGEECRGTTETNDGDGSSTSTSSSEVENKLPSARDISTVSSGGLPSSDDGNTTEVDADGHRPDIPASTKLPEITVKGIILCLTLSIVLGAANTYLGLYAGVTISVSIPAAIMSMTLLRPLGTNILEINSVQTGSSGGSSLAGGLIYTLPALIILGTWDSIQYWEAFFVAAIGGTIGVLFSVPLRRALIVEQKLLFPEGVATAEVLRLNQSSDPKVMRLQFGLIGLGVVLSSLFKFMQTGLLWWGPSGQFATFAGSGVLYFGLNFSPALLAVGYIVKLKTASLMVLGAVINWWILVPLIAWKEGIPSDTTDAIQAANDVWGEYTKYAGVGAMMVGGLGTILFLAKSIYEGIISGVMTYVQAVRSKGGGASIPRTARDIPIPFIGGAILLSTIPLFVIFYFFTKLWGVSAFAAVFMLFSGFLFSAVGAYMAGVVGSSNNPISGVTIATIVTAALLLLLFLGSGNSIGPSSSILIGSVVCCAAALSGDNMQDLKAGYEVGSTPWRLQIMQLIGVVGPSFALPPVINLVIQAYSLGEPTPEFPNPLPAPQANVMADVASAIFEGGLPYGMLAIGGGGALLVLALDGILLLTKVPFRVPVLAIALGLYLPFELSTPIFCGGVVAALTRLSLQFGGKQIVLDMIEGERLAGKEDIQAKMLPAEQSFEIRRLEWVKDCERLGLLVAAGMITGEALVGIICAIPIVVSGKSDVMAFLGTFDWAWPGFITTAITLIIIYCVASWRVLRRFVLLLLQRSSVEESTIWIEDEVAAADQYEQDEQSALLHED